MILDEFRNISKYKSMINYLENAIDFINNSIDLPVGRYEFDGGFLMVQEGITNHIEECNFESHNKYTDIQYVVEGSEVIAWADKNGLKCITEYDEKKDAAFYDGKGTSIEIKAGMSYIMFASDAHKACCHVDIAKRYKKYVIKLPVEITK